jgi:DNA-directed RNA polymerase I, II, and III subunit RPABC1
MTSGSDDIRRLYRVYKTLFQMAHDRGYAVSQAELEMSMEDFLKELKRGGEAQ